MAPMSSMLLGGRIVEKKGFELTLSQVMSRITIQMLMYKLIHMQFWKLLVRLSFRPPICKLIPPLDLNMTGAQSWGIASPAESICSARTHFRGFNVGVCFRSSSTLIG